MADKKDDKKKAPDATAQAGEEGAPGKKSKLLFFVMIAAGALALMGITAGATLYLTGFFNSTPAQAKSAAQAGEGDEAGEGESGQTAEGAAASATPGGGPPRTTAKIPAGERFAATYKPVSDRDFTLNVPNSRRFVQFKVAYKTFYGEKIVERVSRHQIAIESAIITAASQFSEEEMTSLEGRARVATSLRDAMNDVLIRNEDFGGIDEVMFTHFVFQ